LKAYINLYDEFGRSIGAIELEPRVVDALPDTGKRRGELVFNLSDNKLYFWNGSEWKCAGLVSHADTHLKGGSDEVLNLKNINDAIGFSIDSHESRHEYGGDDEIPNNDIVKRFQRFYGGYWFNAHWPSNYLPSSVSGSGYINWNSYYVTLGTGTTANSLARIYKDTHTFYFGLRNWGKKRYFGVSVQLNTDANQIVYLTMGRSSETTPTNTKNHMGFKIIDNEVYGTVGNGTSESTLLLTTFSGTFSGVLECILTPGQECRFYINRTDMGAITTNLPTGTDYSSLFFEATIYNTDAVDKTIQIFIVKALNEE